MQKLPADLAWITILNKVVDRGSQSSPRNIPAVELEHQAVAVDMLYPVVTFRKTNKKFMAAEAEWILRGRNDVEFLAPFNPRMLDYSDDGKALAGAYGPRINSQLDYAASKLVSDLDTRQATISIWTPNPPPSKDIPCTVAMDFKLRNFKLNAHVFMRSSDVWLGLPYDIFSFTMVACQLASMLNSRFDPVFPTITPGTLYVTAASSHVYERDLLPARSAIETSWKTPISQQTKTPLPEEYYTQDPAAILEILKFTSTGSSYRWWES